uniref:Uncharacterized protein n=1 Tax=Romanomermis culicivorax TaxID=13658 RepID=A0A915IXB2_ROMCU
MIIVPMSGAKREKITRMFNAYNVTSVATKLPLGIESVSSKGKTLYGGTKNGGLVSYTPSTSADGTHCE